MMLLTSSGGCDELLFYVVGKIEWTFQLERLNTSQHTSVTMRDDRPDVCGWKSLKVSLSSLEGTESQIGNVQLVARKFKSCQKHTLDLVHVHMSTAAS